VLNFDGSSLLLLMPSSDVLSYLQERSSGDFPAILAAIRLVGWFYLKSPVSLA
jgi:hypothetical protein